MKTISAFLTLAIAGSMLAPQAIALSRNTDGVKPILRTLTEQDPGVLPVTKVSASEAYAAIKKAAEAAEVSTGSIYGFLGYTQENTTRNGWYEIFSDGTMKQIWRDSKFGVTGTYFNSGWIRDGKLCGLFGNASQFFYMEFNLETGAQLKEEEINVAGDNAFKMFRTAAYNPTDDCVYGYSFNSDMSVDYFVKAQGSDLSKAEIIREMPRDYTISKSICYNPVDNQIYGIDLWNDLVKVDVYGNFTIVALNDLLDGTGNKYEYGNWTSGLTYDIATNTFVWNAQLYNYDSMLVRIDPETKKFSKIVDLATWDQLTFMVSVGDDGTPNGPVAPTNGSLTFDGASLSGSATFTMPTVLADGNSVPQTMSWVATLDGKEYKNGTAGAGADVTVDYTDVSNGQHNFGFYAVAGENRGASLFLNKWIGLDTPFVPENVHLFEESDGVFKVTWNPVTRGAHNGDIDVNEIKYAVFIDEKQETITSDCEATINIELTGANRPMTAWVIAFIGDRQSETAISNTIYAGRGWSLSYTIDPTEEQVGMMTFLNPDNDRHGWRSTQEVDKSLVFYSGYDYDNPGNDWLITPKLLFDYANEYEISFDARLRSINAGNDYFEIWIGKSATIDGITNQQIQTKTKVASQSYTPYSYTFKIPEAGSWYIGFRSVSDADQRGWYIRNISINPGAGVEGVADVATAYVLGAKGAVKAHGLDGKTLSIHTTDGRLAYKAEVAGDDFSIELPAGLYIATAGESTWKILVK